MQCISNANKKTHKFLSAFEQLEIATSNAIKSKKKCTETVQKSQQPTNCPWSGFRKKVLACFSRTLWVNLFYKFSKTKFSSRNTQILSL